MIYKEATEQNIMQLVEMRWDFEYENRKFDADISKDVFFQNCYLFLKDGMDKGDWVYWIVEEDNLILSQVFVRKIRKVPKPQKIIDEYGYVTNVYTRPHYRNKGIGQKLMEKVKEWSLHNDLELLIVWPSKRSIKFYERAGFINQNEIMEFIVREDC